MLWLDQPLPVEYRSSIADVLKKIRPDDVSQSLDATKAEVWEDRFGQTLFFARIEANCYDGFCLTLVGTVHDGVVRVDLTLLAGPAVKVRFSRTDFWGADTSPYWLFEARDRVGMAVSRLRGVWLLSACSNCGERSARPVTSPTPPSPNLFGYDEYMRDMKAKGLGQK